MFWKGAGGQQLDENPSCGWLSLFRPLQPWLRRDGLYFQNAGKATHHFSQDDFRDSFKLHNVRKAIKTQLSVNYFFLPLPSKAQEEEEDEEDQSHKDTAQKKKKEVHSACLRAHCVKELELPRLVLPLAQPHADGLLDLDAGDSAVAHLVANYCKQKEKHQFDGLLDWRLRWLKVASSIAVKH